MSRKIFTLFGKSRPVISARSWKSGNPRQFCSASANGGGKPIVDIPLSKEVGWLPKPKYASIKDDQYETQVTTLDNGLRVATENKFGNFCTVGVLIDSGSRYEINYPSGITHFLEKLAFASTSSYTDRDAILQMLEQHGGLCDCQGSRDTLIYGISANSDGMPDVIELLSDVVLRPRVTDEELEESKLTIQFELESLNMRPDPEPLLIEMAHAAAFKGNTLGLPKICPEESVDKIDQSVLFTYMNNFHTPDRMVVAGVGVDHEQLVDLVKKSFLTKTPIWQENPQLIDPSRGRDLSVSQYTGGLIQIEKDLSNVSLGPNAMPELAHCVIGLESSSHKDDDFIAFCVLNMMLGGGGSFSAGGPGKGMYTRLYTNVLNRYHWIYNATAYNHAYDDSGVFCIHASSHPSSMKNLISVIVKELVNTQYGISRSELARAKIQLQSMLLMNLEARPVAFEDVGRQVLANGVRHSAKYYYDRIGKITDQDVIRVAKRMLQTPPAIAAFGDLTHMPTYEHIRTALSSKDGEMPRRFSLFR